MWRLVTSLITTFANEKNVTTCDNCPLPLSAKQHITTRDNCMRKFPTKNNNNLFCESTWYYIRTVRAAVKPSDEPLRTGETVCLLGSEQALAPSRSRPNFTRSPQRVTCSHMGRQQAQLCCCQSTCATFLNCSNSTHSNVNPFWPSIKAILLT